MRTTAALVLLLATPAYAGEGEITLNGELDYHLLFEADRRSGAGLGAEAGYGINDTISLVAQVRGALFQPGEEDPNALRLFVGGGLGLGVTLDVLRVIPVIAVVPSVYRFEDGAGVASTVFGLQAGLSFDYLLSRSASVGVLAGGYQYRATPGAIDDRPDSFMAGLRAGLRFDP